MTDESLLFTLHTDPARTEVTWVTVDRWLPTARVTPHLFDHPGDPPAIEGMIRFTVANGEAVYRVTGWDPVAGVLLLELHTATGPT